MAAGRKAKGEIESLCKVDGGETSTSGDSGGGTKSGKRFLASSSADADKVT